MKKILLISGSLRENSLNTSLLKAFADECKEKAEVSYANTLLPLYDQDQEADFPEAANMLKEQMEASDVIIIASPEYNRGYTSVIKNAVDWASRPHGNNSWKQKTVLVTSATMGTAGGALGVYQLKQVLTHLHANVSTNEFFVASAHEKFDEDGRLTDESTKKHIASAVEVLLQD
jgi:chromate reductase